ncbi:MAG: hypothetical protein IJ112_00645 [Oscillospiraceae bacterium]|nr:hypothetical protein [Oscillospiraceae bacterium]
MKQSGIFQLRRFILAKFDSDVNLLSIKKLANNFFVGAALPVFCADRGKPIAKTRKIG